MKKKNGTGKIDTVDKGEKNLKGNEETDERESEVVKILFGPILPAEHFFSTVCEAIHILKQRRKSFHCNLDNFPLHLMI